MCISKRRDHFLKNLRFMYLEMFKNVQYYDNTDSLSLTCA